MLASYRLRWKLQQLSQKIEEYPSQDLQPLYLQAFQLCQQLPLQQQNRFTSRLYLIRRTMEKQWQAEKQLQLLLETATIKNYQKIRGLLAMLPHQVQQRYAPSLYYLKQKVECGK